MSGLNARARTAICFDEHPRAGLPLRPNSRFDAPFRSRPVFFGIQRSVSRLQAAHSTLDVECLLATQVGVECSMFPTA